MLYLCYTCFMKEMLDFYRVIYQIRIYKDKPAVIDLINSPSPAKNVIFTPRPTPRALTHQVTATQNAHLTPRPKPAEGCNSVSQELQHATGAGR